MIFLTVVDDAVVDVFLLDELPDAAVVSDPVDGVEMIVMPERLAFLRVDILAERRVQIRSFQVMRRQCVSCEHRIYISAGDEPGKSIPCIRVECKSGSHNPDNISVLFFIAEQLVNLIVISRECRLAGAALTECECIMMRASLAEAVRIEIDAFLAVLCAAADDEIAFLQPSRLCDLNPAVFQNRDTVHTALVGKQPFSVNLEIFRVDAHRVKTERSNSVKGCRFDSRIRGIYKSLFREIRRAVLTKFKAHVMTSSGAAVKGNRTINGI